LEHQEHNVASRSNAIVDLWALRCSKVLQLKAILDDMAPFGSEARRENPVLGRVVSGKCTERFADARGALRSTEGNGAMRPLVVEALGRVSKCSRKGVGGVVDDETEAKEILSLRWWGDGGEGKTGCSTPERMVEVWRGEMRLVLGGLCTHRGKRTEGTNLRYRGGVFWGPERRERRVYIVGSTT
jgi:hypothetical protein